MNENKPLFICGMSRGGTTWLGHCLNEHPAVAVWGESLFWGRNYIQPANGESYTHLEVKRVLSLLSNGSEAFFGKHSGNLKYIDKDSWRGIKSLNLECPCQPSELFAAVCCWIANKEDAEYVIEKTPHHVDWISRIKDACPNAKFVVMVRGAYGFMLSYKHQGDRKSPSVKRRFERLYHPVGCAYVWRRYMHSALSAEMCYSNSVLRVEFNALRNEQERVWKEVLIFFELPDAPLVSVLEQNSSFPMERLRLEPIDVFWMNLLAGREMRNAGYQTEVSHVRVFDVLRSLWALIPWGLFVSRHLGRNVSGGVLKYLKLRK